LQFEASLGKWFLQDPILKNSSQKRAGGVAQGVGQTSVVLKKKTNKP
jgi:hypothetical protein